MGKSGLQRFYRGLNQRKRGAYFVGDGGEEFDLGGINLLLALGFMNAGRFFGFFVGLLLGFLRYQKYAPPQAAGCKQIWRESTP